MKKIAKIICVLMCLTLSAGVLFGCTVEKISDEPAATAVNADDPVVTMVIKNYGTITIELYPDMAPNTVNNFIYLIQQGFYDGLTFHRVIEGFMIQGGDPNGNGTGGPDYTIPGEFSANGFTQNTLSHTRGVISMARSSDYDSAGSQFFIMHADATYLDGQYAAFGAVISGMDVVDAIATCEVSGSSSSPKPVKDVVIEKVTVDTKGVTYPEPTKA